MKEEKMKEKKYIYIIMSVLFIIFIAFLGYKLVGNNLSDENQDNFSETQNYNIELNGNTAEVKVGIKVDEDYQSEDYEILAANNEREQKVDLSIEINGKQVALEESTLYPTMGMNDNIKISDIIQEVSTIKGQDNKSYITIVILEKDYNTHDRKNCYIIDENAELIGAFNYKLGGTITVDDYSGEYLKVNEDNIIEYEYNDENQLCKWKYTIKDGTIEKELEKQYSKDEFSGAGLSI